MKKTIFIGICGGSASGKSSIALELQKNFEEKKTIAIIRQDDYYKDQSHMPMEERVKTNYDHPFAFDNELLLRDLNALAEHKVVKKPVYDFVNHTRSSETEIINPVDVLILEGLFVLDNDEIRSMLDIKIFVDTDADIRFIRRLIRDVNKRQRSLESVIYQYTSTVREMHNQFVEPSKKYADIIIPEGSKNLVAMDLLITKISSIISSNAV